MSSKHRKIKTKVLNPSRTRRKNFECCSCSVAKYSSQDYKILFEAKKIIYFLFPTSTKKVYCHECLFKEASRRMKPNEDCIKLLVEDVDGNYTLTIDKEE